MALHNFTCHNCGETFFVSSYSKVFKNGVLCLAHKHQCYHCKSWDTSLLPPPRRNYSKDGIPSIGKFSTASDEEKKKILQKRANDHYDGKGKEEKRERFKETMRKMS